MKNYTLILTEQELEFARQLINSDLPVTIKGVEIVAGFKRAVLTAQLESPEIHEPVTRD